ncbi:hypothetical protein B0H13DRAFT_2490129 [Mycena leptocephala]|nr:hypothetical protein B0H13DRAFT_2490129 [Mycena leptocephala]
MSSFNILEFFQLKAGRRVIANKLNSTYGTHYAHYNTHVWCIKDTGNTIIPTDLRVYITSTPCSRTAWSLFQQSRQRYISYDNQLPDEHTSMVLIFDFSTARWTRAPVPQPNTAIQCYGLRHELGPTGTLCLKVDSTALNISTSGSAPSDDTSGSPGSTASAPVTPSKRRKFDPPSLPPSVDSPDSPLASSTSTPSSNVATSMASVADPNARIGPMHYSQLFHQYPQGMPPPTGVYVPPLHPQQGMPGSNLSTAIHSTLPYIDSRTPASTSHPDSVDISSASIAPPSTVPVPDNSAVNRSAANPYSYPMTQVASTSQSNTSTSVHPLSSSPPVPAAHSIQRNPQPATPSGSTSGGSSATVSTPSTVQGPNFRPRK